MEEAAKKIIEINGAGDVLLISAIGLGIVFAVLILLMFIIKLVAVITAGKKKEAPAAAAEAVNDAADKKTAAGSCGDVCLYDVPDKTAAMVMAIVADQLGEPLNTLRFISIKEVK